MAAHAWLKNEFTKDEKYHNLIRWLLLFGKGSLLLDISGKQSEKVKSKCPHPHKLDPVIANVIRKVFYVGRIKRIWYLSPMLAAKVQASLRIRAVSPKPLLLAHTSSESRGTFRQKARSLAPLNGWACAVKICHDGMIEDTNSLDGAHWSLDLPLVSVMSLIVMILH